MSGHSVGAAYSAASSSSSSQSVSSSSASTSNARTRPSKTSAVASPSYIIPMHSSAEFGTTAGHGQGAAVTAGAWPHQIVVNGAKENTLLVTAPAAEGPSSAAVGVAVTTVSGSNGDSAEGVVGMVSTDSTAADAAQQRRFRHSNSVRTSQSADRLTRTERRRSSRPQHTTTGRRRHTQSVASSFVNAAATAAAATAHTTGDNGGGHRNNNANTNGNHNGINNRDSIITTATTASTDSSSTASSNSTANAGGGTGDENGNNNTNANNMRNLRQHLRTLFQMRHVAFRQLIQQAGEFPSLYMVGSVICALFVLVVVLMHFFVNQLVATLALLFSVSHFSDALAFKRFVTGGQPSGWLIAAKILFRQFMVGTVLGQTQWVLPSLFFQSFHQPHRTVPSMTTTMASANGGEGVADNGGGDGVGTFLPHLQEANALPTFSFTLYTTILAQFFIMDLLLLIKLGVSSLPSSWLGASTKRRIYQWMEYSCALYRFMLPFMPWNAYFGAIWWTAMYGIIKLFFGLALLWAWVLATLRFFRSTHIGSLASETECGQGEQCTICFSDFRVPIKLKCSHIFCTECIRTWLDREVTCPICRAVVTREDNHFRNGDSMMPCVF